MEKIKNPTQEWWFTENWIPEAKALKYIKKFVPEADIPPFPLFKGYYQEYQVKKILYEGTARETTRFSTKKNTILRPTTYTPDGIIEWYDIAKGVLFDDLENPFGTCYFKAQLIKGKWITILDVKAPTGTNRHSDTPFSFTRKWMWQRHKLYVNKVMLAPPKKKSGKIPKGYLFQETWTPLRYTWTDALTKGRTMHHKVKTSSMFM
jgi:hypothetical protein